MAVIGAPEEGSGGGGSNYQPPDPFGPGGQYYNPNPTVAKSYPTPKGSKSISTMKAELIMAGYPVPAGDDAVYAAYLQLVNGGSRGSTSGTGGGSYYGTGSGGGGGGGGGYGGVDPQTLALQRERLALDKLIAEREYELQKKQQYSDLTTTLLQAASGLQRPQDWLTYANYTTGGKNIFQQLFGGEAAPAFGAPTGTSKPLTIADLLKSLGMVGDEVGGPTPTTDTNVAAPLPHQINPAVWDSMSDSARQMVLGAAQAGKTSSGFWNTDDYMRQLEAARPKGSTVSAQRVNWGSLGN